MRYGTNVYLYAILDEFSTFFTSTESLFHISHFYCNLKGPFFFAFSD